MRPERLQRPDARAVRQLVHRVGGRFSKELGIDVDAGIEQVERWFLAATLFGTRIPTSVALRTYQALAESGVRTIEDAGRRTWAELVELLDRGGYVRYDYKTASRLLELAGTMSAHHPSGLRMLARLETARLEASLDALPGWGPVTVRLFLRELRGVWRGATPPPDPRALSTAAHLGLRPPRRAEKAWLTRQAQVAGVDVRDLEAALVRVSLMHGRTFAACPGGAACRLLEHA
jgi:hypothetical protein